MFQASQTAEKKSDREEERKWQRIAGLGTIINGLPSQKDDPHTCLSELARSPSVSATHTHPHLLNQSLFHFSSHLLFPFHFLQEFAPSASPWMSVCVYMVPILCVCFGASFGSVTCRDMCVWLCRDYRNTSQCSTAPSNTEPVCVCVWAPRPMQAICLETGHACTHIQIHTHMHTNPQLLICVCTGTK